jgi:hypothetical protein
MAAGALFCSEREYGDFASDSEAWDWINTNAGKQISDP